MDLRANEGIRSARLDVFGNVIRDARQRIRLRAEPPQAPVHVQHEVVEVNPLQLRGKGKPRTSELTK